MLTIKNIIRCDRWSFPDVVRTLYKGRPLMMYVVSERNVLYCSSVKA